MKLSAESTSVDALRLLRDMYRHEMACQIVHDSLHSRSGWTSPFLLRVDNATAGYGSILTQGPWAGTKTLFEFYVLPPYRALLFALFEVLVRESRATAIQAQTNDRVLSVMLHSWCPQSKSEKIVFEDSVALAAMTAAGTIRKITDMDRETMFAHHREPIGDWGIELEGKIVATGGILFHYNRPYGDVFVEVAGPYRRRGLGTRLVSDLKAICYSLGSVPAARCDTCDVASRQTIQKAGFVPCAHILRGEIG